MTAWSVSRWTVCAKCNDSVICSDGKLSVFACSRMCKTTRQARTEYMARCILRINECLGLRRCLNCIRTRWNRPHKDLGKGCETVTTPAMYHVRSILTRSLNRMAILTSERTITIAIMSLVQVASLPTEYINIKQNPCMIRSLIVKSLRQWHHIINSSPRYTTFVNSEFPDVLTAVIGGAPLNSEQNTSRLTHWHTPENHEQQQPLDHHYSTPLSLESK